MVLFLYTVLLSSTAKERFPNYSRAQFAAYCHHAIRDIGVTLPSTGDGFFLSVPLFTHLITSNSQTTSWIRCVLSLNVKIASDKRLLCFVSSGKDATEGQTPPKKKKKHNTYERIKIPFGAETRANWQDCFGIAGRLIVLKWHRTEREQKKKRYKTSSQDLAQHKSTQTKPFQTSS